MKKIRIYISILLIVSILLTGMLITKNNKNLPIMTNFCYFILNIFK